MSKTSALGSTALLQAFRDVSGDINNTPMSITSADASAIRQTATTIKMLAPIQQIAAFEQGVGVDPEAVSKTCREVIAVVRHAAHTVSEVVTDSKSVRYWLKGYAVGVIAESIAKAWAKERHTALERDWSIALCQISTPMIQAHLPGSWQSSHRSISIAASAMSAVNGVLEAHHRNPLGHSHKKINSWATQTILSEATNQVARMESKYDLNDDDQDSLLQSFIKQGGTILARCWESHASRCRQAVKREMTLEQINAVKKVGFPLDSLQSNFAGQMEMMGDIADQTMVMAGKQEKTQNSSLDMG